MPKIKITCTGSKTLKIEQLRDFQGNLKNLGEESFEKLKRSILKHGFSFPVFVWGDQILDGHQRLYVVRKLLEEGYHIDPVPVVEIDARDKTEAAEKLLILNSQYAKITNDGLTEFLSDNLLDINDLAMDLELPGFDLEDFIGNNSHEDNAGLTDEDEVPEVPEEPITKTGDLWLLGNHRLLCGDSTNIEDVERLMNGEKADMTFTSPPYNVGCLNQKNKKGTKKKYINNTDNLKGNEYFNFLKESISINMKYSSELFYNIGLVQNNKNEIFKIITHFAEEFKDIIYWEKKNVAPHIVPGIINNLIEFIICFGDGKRKFLNAQFSQGTYFNVIKGVNAASNKLGKIHKATFPLYLPENIIENFSKINSNVFDPFLGTGTTLIACEKTNRKCFGIELEPCYCDVIIKRWEDFTDQKAERL